MARIVLAVVDVTTSAVVPPTTPCRSDNIWPSILEIASGLVGTMDATGRYAHILRGIRQLIPCDSAALMRLQDDTLVIVACEGLAPEASTQRFVVAEHPRLAQFMRARAPVRISDHDLPDPFDGLIGSDLPLDRVHACLGCALVVDGAAIGALAVDALDPHAFDDVDSNEIAAIARFAAAAMQTTALIERLAEDAERAGRVTRDLVRDTARTSAELIGRTPVMAALRTEVELAGHSDLAVLITGETGAGKEVVARAIHAASPRADRPLIYINCAALPETIAESELFGHLRGAFTGASEHRSGKFEIADKGTLFLDEIGELPLSIQPKLLRALQSGEIQRVGSDKLLHVDVRIVAATNRDLAAEVAAGRFRSDLYHRLSVYPIQVPALRDRAEDISLLAGYFLNEARIRLGVGRIRLTSAARDALAAADWPGNVRELQHTLLRAAVRAGEGRRRELVVIDEAHLGFATAARTAVALAPPPPGPGEPAAAELPLPEAVDQLKHARIASALATAGGNWAEAARMLGLDRGNFHRLARRLGFASTRMTCAPLDGPRNACAPTPQKALAPSVLGQKA